jgi:hypothetical protein
VNKHDGTTWDVTAPEHLAASVANLLAASVCELSGCSSAAMGRVELTLRDILSRVHPLDLQVLYTQVNQAFLEFDDE